jgi:hypothetical protein
MIAGQDGGFKGKGACRVLGAGARGRYLRASQFVQSENQENIA